MRKYVVGVAAVAFTAGLSACGSSGGGSTTSKTHGTSSTTSAPSTAPATTSSTQANTSALPTYQPSTVVSRAPGHTQLTSPDPVSKVSAFYQTALAQGGWSIISSTSNPYSGNFTAKRGNQGVTIAVSTAGPTGTSISVSTYPV